MVTFVRCHELPWRVYGAYGKTCDVEDGCKPAVFLELGGGMAERNIDRTGSGFKHNIFFVSARKAKHLRS